MNFRTGFQHKKYSSKGCLLVYETDGVAVSFLSNAHWKTPEIEGTYIELLDDGDLKQCQVSIPNVSYKDNVIIFKEYYEKKKDEHTFQLPNGKIQIFSWHIRYTGGYAGRIFFYPVPEEKKIYIGHIGHKLPTAKYH